MDLIMAYFGQQKARLKYNKPTLNKETVLLKNATETKTIMFNTLFGVTISENKERLIMRIVFTYSKFSRQMKVSNFNNLIYRHENILIKNKDDFNKKCRVLRNKIFNFGGISRFKPEAIRFLRFKGTLSITKVPKY